MKSRLFTVAAALVVVLSASPALADSSSLVALQAALEVSRIDTEAVVAVQDQSLDLGPAQLHLATGLLAPVSWSDGGVVELVWLGEGTLDIASQDAVERGQLELFSGQTAVKLELTSAVLTVSDPDLVASLLSGPEMPVSQRDISQANGLLAQWRGSAERAIAGAEEHVLRQRLETEMASAFRAAWMQTVEFGDLLASVDPLEAEPFSVGRFVPLELSKRQQRRVDRWLHREQRRGRFVGTGLERLGTWDHWVLESDREGSQVTPGSLGFEPDLYTLDVTANPETRRLEGTARIQLEAVTGGRRLVRVRLFSDLAITAARNATGQPLETVAAGQVRLVLLPEAPKVGEKVEIELDFSGVAFADRRFRVGFGSRRLSYLRDTVLWHPHVGQVDRARYDVTLRWPRRLQLVAAGRREARGSLDKLLWERRVLDTPAVAFGFEVGHFEIREFEVAGVPITLALERPSIDGPKVRGVHPSEGMIRASLEIALPYLQEVFGPLPYEALTVYITARDFSQSLPGVLSLSAFMTYSRAAVEVGFEEHPGTVVAHELAHQWWGHQTYAAQPADVWIQEGLANYAALLVARHHLGTVRGPTFRWVDTLLRPTGAGRSVEEIGPIVLGPRLNSSVAAAYNGVVYIKSAIVLDMLGTLMGEEAFLEVLGKILRRGQGQAISTDEFLSQLEELSGYDLDDFFDRYFFATGIPSYGYRSTSEPDGKGGWLVRVQAELQSPPEVRYRLTATEDGKLDIEKSFSEKGQGSGALAVAPYYIVMEPEEVLLSGQGEPVGGVIRSVVTGTALLDGPKIEFEVNVPLRPTRVFLRSQSKTFAHFFDDRSSPKTALYRQALRRFEMGESTEALTLVEQVLNAEYFVASDGLPSLVGPRYLADSVDGQAQLLAARIHIEAGNQTEAITALRQAEDLLPSAPAPQIARALLTAKARLAALQGRQGRVVELLARPFRRGRLRGDTEALLTLGLAALDQGKSQVLNEVLEVLKRYQVDVTALEQLKVKEAASVGTSNVLDHHGGSIGQQLGGS